MKKSIIFLVCCLSAASIHPMKRPRGNQGGDQNKRPQSRQRVAQNPGAQQNVTQNPIYSLPLDMLVVILKNALGQTTTRAGYVLYVQQYSKLQQVCKFWNNILTNQIPDVNLAHLNPLNTPYAQKLIVRKNILFGLNGNRHKLRHVVRVRCKEAHIADIVIFTQGGADVNDQDISGETLLYYAVYYDYTKIAKYLIEKGADGNCSIIGGNFQFQEKSGLK